MKWSHRQRLVIASAAWVCLGTYKVHYGNTLNERVFGSEIPAAIAITSYLTTLISPFVYAAIGYAVYWGGMRAYIYFTKKDSKIIPFANVAFWFVVAFLLLYSYAILQSV